MGKYFEKTANITGADPSDFITHSLRIPFEEKIPQYREYVETKSQEPNSSWKSIGKATGIASVIGGLLGYGSTGSALGTAAGAGIFGGVSGLLGSIAKLIDDGKIEDAKRILAASDVNTELKTGLIKELQNFEDQENVKKWADDERRHREVLIALRTR